MKDTVVGRHVSGRSESGVAAPNAALLIDFDNVTMGIRSDLQNQLRRLLNSDMIKGKVSVQRAYADWRRYPQYIVPLSEASIDLIFAPAFGANKKNATDIRLAIDALELVFIRPEIGTFILLSGDSDFSALVLKLKEYGKYVIGVGIRESSSDLLIQNCDEYFSYSEITGLAKEGEVAQVRRDPWELVVEAVQKMIQDGDVMRSDRLKQVMQGIDPNFDEKDAGFNRFSKFVLSAAQRGLLALTKMENGQYAVDIGTNANVPQTDGREGADAGEEAKEETATPRRKRARKRVVVADDSTGLSLSGAFELLKQALASLGAEGEQSTDDAEARSKMIELHGSGADPVFESRRFLRLLRQAHDADLIELIKGDGDQYLLKLSDKTDVAGPEETASGANEASDAEEARAKKAKRTTRRKSTTQRRAPKSKKSDKAETDEVVASSEESSTRIATGEAPTSGKTAKRRTKTTPRRSPRSKTRAATKTREEPDDSGRDDEVKTSEEKPHAKRNPRLRHGSRKPHAPKSVESQPESDIEIANVAPVASRAITPQRGSLGSRRGSRGPKPSASRAVSVSGETAASEERSRDVHSGGVSEMPPVGQGRMDGPGDHVQGSKEKEGLIHRLSAAIQRAVGGASPEDRSPE